MQHPILKTKQNRLPLLKVSQETSAEVDKEITM